MERDTGRNPPGNLVLHGRQILRRRHHRRLGNDAVHRELAVPPWGVPVLLLPVPSVWNTETPTPSSVSGRLKLEPRRATFGWATADRNGRPEGLRLAQVCLRPRPRF